MIIKKQYFILFMVMIKRNHPPISKLKRGTEPVRTLYDNQELLQFLATVKPIEVKRLLELIRRPEAFYGVDFQGNAAIELMIKKHGKLTIELTFPERAENVLEAMVYFPKRRGNDEIKGWSYTYRLNSISDVPINIAGDAIVRAYLADGNGLLDS